MKTEDCKILTEYLGECWHDLAGFGYPIRDDWFALKKSYTHPPKYNKCIHCGKSARFLRDNRTFTTRNDMMDLYEAMVRKGEWEAFERYADRVWVDAEWKPHVENHFRGGKSRVLTRMEWLFNLSANPAEYEARCHIVADWIKEASHE